MSLCSLLVLCQLWCMIYGSPEYAQHSARPSSLTLEAALADSSTETCAAFIYSNSGPKHTNVKVNMTLGSGRQRIKVTGHHMSCSTSPAAALYLLPLAADASSSGQLARCRLVHGDSDTASLQRCYFDCECPSEGCTQIMIVHMSKTKLDGWQVCQIEHVPQCDGSSCLHGGACDNQLGGFGCRCVYNYVGPRCETEVNCASSPCTNGGTCTDGSSGYKCTCPARYQGTNCQTVKYRDCRDLYDSGARTSSTYSVYYAYNSTDSLNVFCDMNSGGGGWMVLLNIYDGSEVFNKIWVSYKNGFGKKYYGEWWLGHEAIHRLTNTGLTFDLRVDMTTTSGVNQFIEYNNFQLDNADQRYALTLGSVIAGTTSDCLMPSRGRPFQTSDHQLADDGCPAGRATSWWYGSPTCAGGLLTGRRGVTDATGLVWACDGADTSYLSSVRMMMRQRTAATDTTT